MCKYISTTYHIEGQKKKRKILTCMQKITTIYWMGNQSVCETHPPLVEIAVTVRCQQYKWLNTRTV